LNTPLILVTNDDGVHAPGLKILAEALFEVGDVVVVAPERERSAVSHALTLHKPLRMREVRRNWHSCSGTPADCVYMGLHHVLDRPPDLVVSGINSQVNLGDDVVYSGTAAGAREAALMDVTRALAFSADTRHSASKELADQAVKIARTVLDEDGTPDTFLNINFPRGTGPQTPMRLTCLGVRNYGRQVTEEVDPRGRSLYWVGGSFLGYEDVPGSDCNAVQEGFISVTPVHLRLTHREAMASLENWSIFTKE
jgi:5'-nucleotidase